MSSSQNYIDCPYCGYPYADYYQESSGEAFQACYLCGYNEDVSDYDQDYFDSEDEWAEAQAEVEAKEPDIPSKNILAISKKIVDLMNFYNDYGADGIVEVFQDFIADEPQFITLDDFFDKMLKAVGPVLKFDLIKGIFDEES